MNNKYDRLLISPAGGRVITTVSVLGDSHTREGCVFSPFTPCEYLSKDGEIPSCTAPNFTRGQHPKEVSLSVRCGKI